MTIANYRFVVQTGGHPRPSCLTVQRSTRKIAHSVGALVGNTPLFLWRHNSVNLYLKLEMFNPGRSIKDRVAFFILDNIMHTQKPSCIVEYSSGNLGIGLALCGLAFGIEIIIIATDKTSQEKVKLLKALGASVVVTQDDQILTDTLGMITVAEHIAARIEKSYFVNQFHTFLELHPVGLTSSKPPTDCVRNLASVERLGSTPARQWDVTKRQRQSR